MHPPCGAEQLRAAASDYASIRQSVRLCLVPINGYGFRALCKSRAECDIPALRHAVKSDRYDRAIMMIIGADRIYRSGICSAKMRLSGIILFVEADVLQNVAIECDKAVAVSAYPLQFLVDSSLCARGRCFLTGRVTARGFSAVRCSPGFLFRIG